MSAIKKLKTRKCKAKGCGNTFTPFNSLEQWCSPGCGFKLSQEKLAMKQAKAKLEKKRERIAAKKKFKENDRPLQVKLTQTVVNRYVVQVQEAGKGCYTCDDPLTTNKADCGHWLTRGAHPEKARDTRHMRKQCVRCNRYEGGRPAIFEANLRAELGDDVVDEIVSYKPDKATCSDLIDQRKHFRKLLKEAGF